MASVAAAIEAFPGHYGNLINAERVQCLETKTIFDAILKPTAIILDVGYFSSSMLKNNSLLLTLKMFIFKFFLLPILEQIRSATRKSVPVLTWATLYASSTLRFLGPKKFGGYGDAGNLARALAETTGRNVDDVLDEVGPYFYSWACSARDRSLTVDTIPPLVVSPGRRKPDKCAWVASAVRL